MATASGFWRMLEVTDKHNIRCCVCLNGGVLDHCPEIRDAMVARNWDYMAHGFYNTRPITAYSIEEERTYWQRHDRDGEEAHGQAAQRAFGRGRRQHRQHPRPHGRVRAHLPHRLADGRPAVPAEGEERRQVHPRALQLSDQRRHRARAEPGRRVLLPDDQGPVRRPLRGGRRERQGDVHLAASVLDRQAASRQVPRRGAGATSDRTTRCGTPRPTTSPTTT